MPANLENSAVATGLEKVSFHSNPKETQCQECSNFCTVALISQSNAQNSPSQASTVCELRNSRSSNWIQERNRNQRWNCQHMLDNRKKQRVPEKCLLLIYWLYRIFGLTHSKLWKLYKRWEYQTILSASREICMQVKKQQLELEMEQWSSSKLGKEYVKAVYCHPVYLICMQSTRVHNAKGWAGWITSRN